MRGTSWHACLSCWVTIWSAQTCDINSFLIVILMCSEGACMGTTPIPKHPNMQQYGYMLWLTCQDIHIVVGWQYATQKPLVTPRSQSPLISIGIISTGQLRGRAFYFKITHLSVCMHVVFVCVVCIVPISVCRCLRLMSHYRSKGQTPTRSHPD